MRRFVLLSLLWLQQPVDLLGVATTPDGPRPPVGWKVRNVRGQDAPVISVAREGGVPVLRLTGAGRAAWFYREVELPSGDPGGTLKWSWRVTDAPVTADMRIQSADDSPLRVYVVFGRPSLFRSNARIIFYTFGNGEPPGFVRRSFASDKIFTVRVDGAAERSSWRDHALEPFTDYRRFWKGAPPPITAIGVMQDTDQTGALATAELRQLTWSGP